MFPVGDVGRAACASSTTTVDVPATWDDAARAFEAESHFPAPLTI